MAKILRSEDVDSIFATQITQIRYVNKGRDLKHCSGSNEMFLLKTESLDSFKSSKLPENVDLNTLVHYKV